MAPNARDYEAERTQRIAGARQFGQRLRKARLTYQISRELVSVGSGIPLRTVIRYELGSQTPPPDRVGLLAAAIGCPIASLFVDEVVLAEIRVSPETLERVRSEGQPGAAEVAGRIASTLEPLLLAEATRPPVDLRPGARARKRRNREQVLAGVAAARLGRDAHKRREAAGGEIT